MIASNTMAVTKDSATVGRAREHEVDGGLADALEDEGAEAAAADQSRHRGKPDILHQGDADARRMTGSASGNSTCRRRWRTDKPMPRAASVTAAGTWFSPVTVLATTGSRE